MSRHEVRNDSSSTTSSSANVTYVARFTVVKVPWWKRVWRRLHGNPRRWSHGGNRRRDGWLR